MAKPIMYQRLGCRDLDPMWPGLDGKPRGPVLCVSYPQCSCGRDDVKSGHPVGKERP